MELDEITTLFIEESTEGLDSMESGLMALDSNALERSAVDAIFRAAHSIKGGAGTFGFPAIGNVAHGAESVLVAMREDRLPATPALVSLLLETVDLMRAMLAAGETGVIIAPDRIADTQARLAAAIHGESAAAAPSAETALADDDRTAWKIEFRPSVSVFERCIDPVALVRPLAALGELASTCLTDALPTLDELDPEQCYLAWRLTLRTNAPREQIAEVFDWVEGDCVLSIEPVAGEVRADEPTDAPAPGGSTALSGGRPPSSIRVGTERIDELINLVGELVITQSMLHRAAAGTHNGASDELQHALVHLERSTRNLQDRVLRIRMLPIGTTFARFRRIVRDLAGKLDKTIKLHIEGESTELDKTVLEQVGDPLLHLVRNAIDHGIESADARLAAGKSGEGNLTLRAYHESGSIVVEVEDDGAGLNRNRILSRAIERGVVADDADLSDEQINQLILEPGFSTAEQVSDVSGRGVGMDVVRSNIELLGGTLRVHSTPGIGCRVVMRLPLTLAIVDGQIARLGDVQLVFPLVAICESVRIAPQSLKRVCGDDCLYRVRDNYIPIVMMDGLFNHHTDAPLTSRMLIILESEGQMLGVCVDELLGQQQVVLKSLEQNFRPVPGLSGATVMGDGTVALIVDTADLIRRHRRRISSGELHAA